MTQQFTSHSRLGVFESCAQKFYREYILRERVSQEADYFIIGTMCHSAIEDMWNGLYPTVHSALGNNWTTWLRERQLGHLRAQLDTLASDIGNLWKRASADYMGRDAIRKAGNQVADNPVMTKAWKDAVSTLKIDFRQDAIDTAARSSLGEAFRNVSIVNCYSETHTIMSNFRDPECLASLEYLEFPLSERIYDEDPNNPNGKKTLIEIQNPVIFPQSGTYLNGYIDVVGRGHDGGIILLDHKTSSGSAPSVVSVAHNEQLLQYAWAWHQLTGEWPTHIGINHLRTGKVILAPVVPEHVMAVIERRENLLLASSSGIYPKKDPFAYNSPCLKMRDGVISDHCPHLAKCHTRVAEDLGILTKTLPEGL